MGPAPEEGRAVARVLGDVWVGSGAALAGLEVVPAGSTGSCWCQPHKKHLSRAGRGREKLFRGPSLQTPKHEVQEEEDAEMNASLSLWVLSSFMIEAFVRLIKRRLFCVPEQSGMETTRKCF